MGRAFEYRRAAKEKRWDLMSKRFPKLSKAITIAAKEGGSDPEMNPTLRLAIQNAKAENMPKDNIEAAIKRAEGKDAEEITEVTYEGKGPHSSLLFVECATDNINRTIANIRTYFNKAGGSVVTSGSLEFMFNRKAFFKFPMTEEMDLDELELELIDHGLEEIQEEDGEVTLLGDFKDYGTLAKALEENGLEINKSGLTRIPVTSIELSEEQMEEVEKLIDKLEDDDDVQTVFTNIA